MKRRLNPLDAFKKLLIVIIKILEKDKKLTLKNKNEYRYIKALLLITEKQIFDMKSIKRFENVLYKIKEKVETCTKTVSIINFTKG